MLVIGLSLLGLAGCAPSGSGDGTGSGGTVVAAGDRAAVPDAPRINNDRGIAVLAVNLNDPVKPITNESIIQLDAARNEWASFAVQLNNLPAPDSRSAMTLRVNPLRRVGGVEAIPPDQLSASQVLPMPVDTNRAGYVRHTGLSVATRRLPRAMLPVAMKDGAINVAALRDPSRPTDPAARAGGPGREAPIVWVDLHVPLETPPGDYQANIELLDAREKQPLAVLPVRLRVYDFVMPDERHLLMVSQLRWESLIQHFPDRMESITPRLINRGDPRYKDAVRTMDELITVAHAHRAQIIVPRLQPTVKWPAGRPPQIDWQDFDSVVAPWLTGEMFADKTPLGYWPLPQVDYLHNFDTRSQAQYWGAAAAHFDQRDWLGRSSVFLDKSTPGRASVIEALQFSERVANILESHPRIRVTSPLEEDQLILADSDNPMMIDPQATERLIVASPGLIYAPPTAQWPENVAKPQRWLRTDLPGLVPYVGAGGDERDVRQWAWLAFLRQAGMILWDGALPQNNDPEEPADPNRMVWFYPGHWFGVDQPVPTIQLKWLRRAQQDYEYLYLAQQRGEILNALVMARLITKPVQIQPHQPLDPVYAMMTGTADQKAWSDVQRLVAKTILLREPGEAADPSRQSELYLETMAWLAPQERPTLLGRTVQWGWAPGGQLQGHWADLRFGVDIYNASDDTPTGNSLEFTALPPAWQVRPQPRPVPPLEVFRVRREEMDARVNLDEIRPGAPQPVELTFTLGFKQTRSPLRLVIPAAVSDRREGGLKIDGSIEDWTPEDAIQTGPMVAMFTRPSLQRQALELADTPTQIYTTWGGDHFYVAFRLTGVSDQGSIRARNFVDYQFRRAWGEDLCQVLIQPIYDDNSVGPVLHIVAKPNGGTWIERKLDTRTHADPWQPLQGVAVRFATTVSQGIWRGELAIPWDAIRDREKGMPRLLRFNLAQHNDTTGKSASWAGPVDYLRDEQFMGLIFLREPETPGMRR